MPQYLYRIQPTRTAMLAEGPNDAEAQRIGEHFEYLEGLTTQGTVLMAGRTLNADASAFGIVVFLAESDSAAQAIVDADPAVKHGVMTAEVFPYRVALWSRTGPS